MVTLVFGGGYWYYTALAVCNVPLSYQIGTIDAQFGLSEEQAQNAISGAESVWEDGTNRNLFTGDPDGKIVINFVYDERQQRSDEEAQYRKSLEQREGISDTVRNEYENLLSQYEKLRNAYSDETEAYESKLNAYNAEVAKWNKQGGAPKDTFERLQDTQKVLASEEDRLNAKSAQLNEIVRKMNMLGDKGNSLINDYNSLANEYNSRFSEEKEFTQGDYENKIINIYEFDTEDELVLVLAHEFGHALSLGHVDETTAIMHHTMGEQSLSTGLTLEDKVLFEKQCGTEDSIPNAIRLLVEALRRAFMQ